MLRRTHTKLQGLWLILLIFAFCRQTLAQREISGRILDLETSRPLSGADIYLAKGKLGTVSDGEGFFKLRLPAQHAKDDSLTIHYIGYHKLSVPLKDVSPKTIYYLTPLRLQLEKPIEIEAERINLSRLDVPHLTQSIQARQIERYGPAELSTVLKSVSSIRLQGNEIDGKQIQIRGSNANEVNVYLDGVLLNDLSSSNVADLSIVPADHLNSIEVHKAANMLVNGNGAFGGVINLITKQPSRTEAELKFRYGSFNSQQYFGSLGLPLGKNVVLAYYGQWAKMNPTVEFFPDETLADQKTTNDHIKQKKFNHYLNLNFQMKAMAIKWKAFYYGLRYQKPGWEDQRSTLVLSNQNQLPGAFHLTLNYLQTKDKVTRYIFSSSKDLYDYLSRRLNIRLLKTFKVKRGTIQAFTEYWHERLSRGSSVQDSNRVLPLEKIYFYDNRASASVLYHFAEQHNRIKHLNWQVHFGFRGDLSASGYRDISNALGGVINWRKNNQNWQLLLSYGRNVRYPTLFEMALNRDYTVFTLNDTTHKKLEPEYSQSFDLGLKIVVDYFSHLLPQAEYNLSFFYRTVYNKLLKQPFGQYLIQAQIGRNRTSGFEVSVKLKEILGFADIESGLTRLYISDHLLYEFKPQLRYNVMANFSHSYFNLSLNYFFEGKSYGWYYDQLNRLRTRTLQGYNDLDLSMSVQSRHWPINLRLQFSAYNLFDHAGYRYYYLNKRFLQFTLSLIY